MLVMSDRAVFIPGCLYGQSTCSIRVELTCRDQLNATGLVPLNALLKDALDQFHQGTDSPPAAVGEPPVARIALTFCYWIHRMQTLSRWSVHQPGTVTLSSNGMVCHCTIPTVLHGKSVTLQASRLLLDLFLATGVPADVNRLLNTLPDVLEQMKKCASTFSTNPRFVDAAFSLDIPVTELPQQTYQYGYGRYRHWMRGSFTGNTTSIATYFARDKFVTASILRSVGLPAPRHRQINSEVNSAEEVVALAESLGFPVVVKPATSDAGKGVFAGLESAAEVASAYEAARKFGSRLLIEKHVEGRDYRFIVMGDELLWAIERIPGGVTGNGVLTIRELISELNKDPRRGEGTHSPLKKVELDEEARLLLAKLGLDENSVPAKGVFIRLRRVANVATGGMPVVVLDQVHEDNRRLAIRVARLTNLDLAGVDILCPDIGKSWKEVGATICEINAAPQLGGVTGGPLYPLILRKLINGNGRIPTVVVVGAEDDSMLVSQIHDELTLIGFTPGSVSSSGVVIGNERCLNAGIDPFRGGRLLMFDEKVSAAIVSIVDAEVLKSGLPFDRFDILLVAGKHVESKGQGRTGAQQRLTAIVSAIIPHCSALVVAERGAGLLDPFGEEELGRLQIITGVQQDTLAHTIGKMAIEANEKHRTANAS